MTLNLIKKWIRRLMGPIRHREWVKVNSVFVKKNGVWTKVWPKDEG